MNQPQPEYGPVMSDVPSMRDLFAAHALQGLLARAAWTPARLAAKAAYEFADAMLAEREQDPSKSD